MPKRLIAGQTTHLSRTMHDIRYDEIHDEFYVTSPFAQAILVFAGNANGDVAPKRFIQGPKTKLVSGIDRLEVDAVHQEIIVPMGDEVLIYSSDASGDVAPIRTLRGKDTQLRQATSVVVDPVNNALIVGLDRRDRGGAGQDGAILIFNRTDDGNVKPRSIIRGPKSGITRINQMAVYPPRKWVVASQPGQIDVMEPEGAFVGIWSLDDNGDVAPRWKIDAGPNSDMKKPRGVVLDAKHKELIVADMRINAVLTYYFPEMF